MQKRRIALAEAKIAGYHSNSRYFTRLIIESRVNRQSMNEAWAAGVSAKKAGISCGCRYCDLTGGDKS